MAKEANPRGEKRKREEEGTCKQNVKQTARREMKGNGESEK